jgi:hypothetical protein
MEKVSHLASSKGLNLKSHALVLLEEVKSPKYRAVPNSMAEFRETSNHVGLIDIYESSLTKELGHALHLGRNQTVLGRRMGVVAAGIYQEKIVAESFEVNS